MAHESHMLCVLRCQVVILKSKGVSQGCNTLWPHTQSQLLSPTLQKVNTQINKTKVLLKACHQTVLAGSDILVAFLIVVTIYLTKQFKDALILAHDSRVLSIMAGKSWWQGCGAVEMLPRQSGGKEGWMLVLSLPSFLYIQSRAPAHAQCCPHLG